MSQQPLGLGIAGLGTVGATVARLVLRASDAMAGASGRALAVRAVSARDRRKDRGVDLSAVAWCDDPVEIARRDDVDVVVELIGGSDGPAVALAREALGRGKSLVTANKAMIAVHGRELAALAEENGASLRFEAAVAGGIPIIKALREGLAGNQISRVSGILNGTCNYILTTMEEEGAAFADVLKRAQDLGYAEADPSFDINGMDTAHKTAILAALAFHAMPDLSAMSVEGIESIAPVDIDYARELGYRIKLLGVVAEAGDKRTHVQVAPAMVPLSGAIAAVGGPTNAVQVVADPVGETVYEGPGAGGGATASAVLGDIIDVARGAGGPTFARPAAGLSALGTVPAEALMGTYYVRLCVDDKPGVMADLTRILADETVSIESLLQRGRAPGGGVYVVFTTHSVSLAHMASALDRLKAASSVLETPTMIRIEAD